MRVAAIDCGTNTIRLLILEQKNDELRELQREMRIVRLGEGVDARGEFAPAALARTFAATSEYAKIIAKMSVDKVAFIATSASRDVRNRQEYEAGIHQILGVKPQVISGEKEASLAFKGVLSGLQHQQEPVLVVDIGGGSTEFILGSRDRIISAISTDMGSVRLYERYLQATVQNSDGSLKYGSSLPSTQLQQSEKELATPLYDVCDAREKTRVEVRYWLEKAEEVVDFSRVRVLVGVAGTITSIAAKALGLKTYDSRAINGAALKTQAVLESCRWMMEATVTERCQLGFMDKYRADVIGAGALIWQEIIQFIAEKTEAAGYPLETIYSSEHDILDGIALEMLWAGRNG